MQTVTPDLAARIESYLYAAQDWVGADELCRVFDVKERTLRATGKQPGLCSDCAISGDKGFRHVKRATDEEFAQAYARMRRHGIAELVHARQLKAKRLAVVLPPPPLVFERATGQAVLFTDIADASEP